MAIFEKENKKVVAAAQKYIEAIVRALLEPPKVTPFTRNNRKLWPAAAGVYALYRGRRIIWVGESGSLRKRANDLYQTRNHSFRRVLGEKLFSKRLDFERATTTKQFSPDIEAALTYFMEHRLSFVVAPVSIGRKEIEERACAQSTGLFNVRKQRGT